MAAAKRACLIVETFLAARYWEMFAALRGRRPFGGPNAYALCLRSACLHILGVALFRLLFTQLVARLR